MDGIQHRELRAIACSSMTANNEPQRSKLRNAKDDPREQKSNTENEKPKCTMLLNDGELPKWSESKTDRENSDPSRAIPKKRQG